MNPTLDTGLAAVGDLNGGSYRPGTGLNVINPLYPRPIQNAIDFSRSRGLFGVDHVIVETAEGMSGEIYKYLHERDGYHSPAQLYVDPREIMTNDKFLKAYRLAVSGKWLNQQEEHLLKGIVGILAHELKPDFFKEIESQKPK